MADKIMKTLNGYEVYDEYSRNKVSELSEQIVNETTDREKAIADLKAQGIQQIPLFANDISECTDTSKFYVLPDGYIYGYLKTTTNDSKIPNFTNIMDDANSYVKKGYRYSASSGVFKEADGTNALVFKLPAGTDITSGVVIRITYPLFDSSIDYATYFGTSSTSFNVGYTATWEVESDGICKTSKTLTDSSFQWVIIHVTDSKLNCAIDDIVVTVNEEISYSIIDGGNTYQWGNTNRAFIPLDYEDRIIDVENKTSDNTDRISDIESEINVGTGIKTMFISPSGNDSNDGLTASKPKKTVKACIDAGAKRISAKRGTYNEQIILSNIDVLEIFPTDNDYTFDANIKRYPPIIFDTSHVISVSSLSAYNNIKQVVYAENNEALSYVFTNELYDKVYSTTHGYHAVLWMITGNIKNDFKLKPLATISEVESTVNSFTWINDTIYLNADLTNVAEIRVPTIYGNALTVFTANKVKLTDVEVDFAGRYNILIENCPDIEMNNCSTKYSSNGSGFDMKNVNGVLRNCYASKVHDGYGIGDYGHTIIIDCVAEWCYDDGISHHRGCTGTVIGGRFEGNGKAGNCPAHGANVNIYGGIYKDNALWGIAYWYENTYNPCSGMIQNATIIGNPKGLVVDTGSSVIAVNCHYVGNTKDKEITGALVEY